ncbi:MAG: hypothetical protein M8357_10870 [Desulfobulbaceae bacterium]|nr:hypothetical protein [Desulfobulbaceae bacterium]
MADYLMLNTMVWHGEKILDKIEVKPAEWQATYLGVKLITELDPRFLDPYVLAETSLPWEAGMVEETNELLLKAASVLKDNYRPYFFLWFNHYYFLKDPETAGMYLEKAAIVPGAPQFYKTLAARMRLQSGNIMSGIIFLQEMLKETRDAKTKLFLQKRLDTLRIIAALEKHVGEYIKQFNQQPENLSDLVREGLMEEIPRDPYGGEFYIMENGRVYTTSNLVQLKSN